eukprot:7485016-Pyramimonas_sp.AAC.1
MGCHTLRLRLKESSDSMVEECLKRYGRSKLKKATVHTSGINVGMSQAKPSWAFRHFKAALGK